MTVTGYTFDKAIVPANRDSILYDKFNFGRSSVIKGRENSLELTSSGLNVTVATGFAIVQGRLIEVSSPEIVAVPANTTGYIVVTIDLSQNNTTTGTPGNSDYDFNLKQGRVEFVKTLISEDTNEGHPVFNLQLAAVTSQTSSVSINKNYNVYNNYVLAEDGVVFGNDVNNYGSAIVGDRWYRNKAGSLKVATLDKGLEVVHTDDSNRLMPISASELKLPTDTNGWVDFTIEGSFQHYADGQNLRYKSKNGLVNIVGAVRPTKNLTNNGLPEYVIATLPNVHRPPQMVTTVVQGSYNTIGLATVWPDGTISVARLRNGANGVDFQKDSWLTMNITFLL